MGRDSRIIVIVDHPGRERIAFEVRGTVNDSVELDPSGTLKVGHTIQVRGTVEEKYTFKGPLAPPPEKMPPEAAEDMHRITEAKLHSVSLRDDGMGYIVLEPEIEP